MSRSDCSNLSTKRWVTEGRVQCSCAGCALLARRRKQSTEVREHCGRTEGGALGAYAASPPTVSGSAYAGQGTSSPPTYGAAGTEESGEKGADPERTPDVVVLDAALLDLAQQCEHALDVVGRLHERLGKALESASENLHSDLIQSRSDLNRIKCHLLAALATKDVIQAETPKVTATMKSHPTDKIKLRDGQTSEKSFREPLITLEAVRAALRALEARNRRQNGRKASFLSKAMRRTGFTAGVYTELECYECGKVGHK